MPSDRLMSAESRAAKMAGEDVKKVIEGFKGVAPFMGRKPSTGTLRRHQLIFDSPAATSLLEKGYTMGFAERVARMELEEKRNAPWEPQPLPEQVPE